MLGPRLEKIITENDGKVILAKVDIDEHSEIAMDYGVSFFNIHTCMVNKTKYALPVIRCRPSPQ
jgi:hypothetical protein